MTILRSVRHVPVWPALLLVIALALGLAPPSAAGAQEAQQQRGSLAYAMAPPGAADPDAGDSPTPPGLAVVDVDGATGRRLTTPDEPEAVDRYPRWSPDGHWLAFTRNASDGRRPLAVSATGATVTLAESGWHAAWSPQGDQLVWAVGGATPGLVVAQVATDSGQLTISDQRVIPTQFRADGPVFSPDGLTLAFRMRRGFDTPGADLWAVDVDGSDMRQVTSDVNLAAGPADGHGWSPDGSQLAFLASDAASRGGQRGHIVNRDGTSRRLLYPASGCEFTRAMEWAPHGEFLAVLQSCQEEGFQLVTPTGERLGAVGAGALSYGGVAFSPDGADLFVTARPAGSDEDAAVMRIPLDGSASVVVTQTPPATMTALDVMLHGEVVVQVVRPPADEEPEPNPGSGDPKRRRPLLEYACPISEVPYADFLDVELENPHRLAIDCMAWWKVASGTGEHAYSPAAVVTRAQMASFLARMIVAGGGELPILAADHFDDDARSPHADNINRLAEAGVVRGVEPRRFRPNANVRRDQMATFVMAAYRYIHPDDAATAPRDSFVDDDASVHEAAINAAAAQGFVTGVGDGHYAPERAERRAQAASRAARVLDALVELGYTEPPREGLARVTKIVDGDTVLANDPVDGTVRIRFVGINATETGTCGAEAATESLRELVGGKTIRLSSDDPSSIGHRERKLRFVEVYGPNGWIDVNAEQLRRGHALWFPNEDGKEPRNNNLYQHLARQARRQDLNLWDRTRCGYGPQQGARLRMWVRANPEGRDEANLNGEWVRIANDSTTTVDLTGWALRDSSARRPYTFPADSVIGPGATMTVHVGDGVDAPLVRYMGRSRALFANASKVQGQWVGDGAYLLDPDGDIRDHFMYPCIGTCGDPLVDAIRITKVVRGAEAVEAGGEMVVLRNISKETISLNGYRLMAPPATFDLPVDTQIAPTERLRVRVGAGTDTARTKYWPAEGPLFDSPDGSVSLRTYDGITIACSAWGASVC